MNKELTKEIKKYLKDIKKSLNCDFNTKKAFISILKNEISVYLLENQNANIENIINEFGSPEQFNYNLKNYDYNLLTKKAKSYLKLEVLFITLSFILLVILIITILFLGGRTVITNPH